MTNNTMSNAIRQEESSMHASTTKRHRTRSLLTSIAAAVAASLAIAAPTAQAEFGIAPGHFSVGTYAQDGTAETQAAAHPYSMVTEFQFNTKPNGSPEESVRALHFDLPRGISGNPEATAKCEREGLVLMAARGLGEFCPHDSQIGIAEISYWTPDHVDEYRPVYNLVPAPGKTAQIGFPAASVVVSVDAGVDTAGDFSLTADQAQVPQSIQLVGVKLRLWGVPNDPIHDAQRACGTPLIPPGPDNNMGPCPVSSARMPFLTNAASCIGQPLAATMTADSWQNPGIVKSATAFSSPITGCGALRFAPSLDVTSDTTAADSPAGIQTVLDLPQKDDVETGLAAPPLRTARVALPEGMTINPSSADGLDACTDAQLGLHSNAPIACPAASKIGTVTAETPVLTEPLIGSVYVRSQNSSDPESGEMFRLAMVLKSDERGLLIKLGGQVRANAITGRLEATFDDNPQLPVSKIDLRLKTGPRAAVATPQACGSALTNAQLASWAGQAPDLTDTMAIGCPGATGFAPAFAAGTTGTAAGAFAPFAVQIGRPDGQQFLDGASIDLPTGSLAKLKGVPLCPEAQAATGTCDAGSRVGSATVGAGAGSAPFYLRDQPVYLGGPYKGAPFSLVVASRAVAGPFDLGTVVVRQALRIDPIDAHVTVVSDPLPTIVKGVPLRLRSVDVKVDRPDFTINPTSCAPKVITGTLHSVAGQSATVAKPFQVSDCSTLDLEPSLGLALIGKGQTTDGKHPAITATLTQKPGQANLKKVRVTMPLSLALDVDNANGLCEFVDGSKVEPTCPKNSIVGTATAVTPVLDEPLSGPVYFVKNVRKDPKSGRNIRTLPKLVIPLVGQNGVKLTLTGTSDVEDGQLVTTFDNIPDAPVSGFKLSINGGKGGILAVSGTDICKSTQIADQQIDGQNNKNADADVYIQTPSCPLKVISKKVGKTAVAVKVGGVGAGKVTVTGKGIRKTTKIITKSTVATITAKRTKGKPGKVTVSFRPKGAKKAKTAGVR